MNMGGQMGGAVAAITTPLIALKYGWTISFLTAAGLCILGAALWLAINPNRSLTPSEKRL
jgi:ACS family glucarate transporter-like MFS transporter